MWIFRRPPHARRSRRSPRTRLRTRREETPDSDVTLDPLHALYPAVLMCCATPVEGDPCRAALGRKRLGVGGPRLETRRPLVKRHLADLCERTAHHRLGRLVVEHELPLIVGDQRRRREIRCELAGEDENQVLVSPLLHRRKPTPMARVARRLWVLVGREKLPPVGGLDGRWQGRQTGPAQRSFVGDGRANPRH
jgi:hypothetical protein